MLKLSLKDFELIMKGEDFDSKKTKLSIHTTLLSENNGIKEIKVDCDNDESGEHEFSFRYAKKDENYSVDNILRVGFWGVSFSEDHKHMLYVAPIEELKGNELEWRIYEENHHNYYSPISIKGKNAEEKLVILKRAIKIDEDGTGFSQNNSVKLCNEFNASFDNCKKFIIKMQKQYKDFCTSREIKESNLEKSLKLFVEYLILNEKNVKKLNYKNKEIIVVVESGEAYINEVKFNNVQDAIVSLN